jgi:hypothetical protein
MFIIFLLKIDFLLQGIHRKLGPGIGRSLQRGNFVILILLATGGVLGANILKFYFGYQSVQGRNVNF